MQSNSKKKLSIIAAVVIVLIAAAGVVGYLLTKQAEPSAPQTAQSSGDKLPQDLKDAVTSDLSLTGEEYLKQAEQAQSLNTYAEEARTADDASFAGVFLDQSGKPHLNVTSESAKQKAQSNNKLPANTVVSVVANTQTELENKVNQTQAWAEKLPAVQRNAIAGIAPNLESNNVVVIVKQSDGAAPIQAPQNVEGVKILETRNDTTPTFPTPFTIVGDKTSSRGGNTATLAAASDLPVKPLGDGKIRGGDGYGIGGILPNGSRGQQFCSVGFNGTDAKNNPIIFTAGHCSTGVDASVRDHPTISRDLKIASGELVTDEVFGRFTADGVKASKDVAIAAVTTQQDKFRNAQVRTGNGSTVTVTGVAKPVPGMPVCKFGRTTGYTCGRGVIGGISLPVGGTWYKNLFITNACARPGDSGGANISGTLALGVTTGGPMILGTSTASCFKNDLISVLLGRVTYVTPITDALSTFPGTKINTGR